MSDLTGALATVFEVCSTSNSGFLISIEGHLSGRTFRFAITASGAYLSGDIVPELIMRSSPSISPTQPDDRDVYLVLDDFGGRLGRAWRETDEESAYRHAIITDLVDGQYSNPVRVIAFNTAQGWSRDVSAELADLILQRCARDGFDVPPSLEGFVDRHGTARPAQLHLPLRGAA